MRYVGANPIEVDLPGPDGLPVRVELLHGGEIEMDEERAAIYVEAVDMWVSVSGDVPARRVDPPAAPAERKG